MNSFTRHLALSHPFQIARCADERSLDAHASGFGAMAIIEDDSGTHFEFDVPGFSSDDITIDLQDDHFVVSGELSETETCGAPAYSERRSGTFRRIVRLDSRFDPASADAELRDGVLTLSLARNPEFARRRIGIRNTTSTD